MTRLQTLVCVAIGLMAMGCTASAAPAVGAPTIMVVHAEAGLLARPRSEWGFGSALSAALGFEVAGCCELGTYANYSRLSEHAHLSVKEPMDPTADNAKAPYVSDILEGGLEFGAVAPLPVLDDRLRFRLRAGVAGTPPTNTTFGRRGLAGSVAAVVRLSNPDAPDVGRAAPQVDLLVGGALWSLSAERNSAGEDDSSAGGAAVMVALRVGAGYGIDLK